MFYKKMDVFSGVITVCLNMDNFNENEFFKEYPYFEKYNYNKIYDKEFFHDYKKYGTKRYKSVLYKITDSNNKYEDKEYVVHEEDITDKDLEELQDYCQCRGCNGKTNDIDFCSICAGCLKTSMFPPQWNINKARDKKYDYMECD
jgi:hypothetical protein